MKEKLTDASAKALEKLIDNKGKVDKLTRLQMSAILLNWYNRLMEPQKNSKKALTAALTSEISGNKNALGAVAVAANFSAFDGTVDA